ncbi:MAG: MBL fold metallo-hydrolase [Ignavibacteriales bacterium CG12_big_fil_rev_8_21_14_0_65_30_8]|nr:MAG: MBL fold metallo-hydrolase [Ignavibacteriales bacterium CG12_big_fil_rev_8_21_14_0_65_30_8]
MNPVKKALLLKFIIISSSIRGENLKPLRIFIIIYCLNVFGYSQIYDTSPINFIPINHASFIITNETQSIYVDPVQDISAYQAYQKANIILITHIHGDHFKPETVNKLKNDDLKIIGPKNVIDELGFGTILNNGENIKIGDILIEAIPMYNLTEDRLKFHEKGKGNGYVVTMSDKRIYISGDTEDIKEMRELKNIDYAFVCMNLPYTMTVEQATSAVLEFKPKVVYPYHYRGTKGYSDIEKFKRLVSVNRNIDIILLKWY